MRNGKMSDNELNEISGGLLEVESPTTTSSQMQDLYQHRLDEKTKLDIAKTERDRELGKSAMDLTGKLGELIAQATIK
ncbi:bacteriocin [Anaerovibrio sp.]|uniref:bacteriocin n=1 Tax=Anaerovibrio sp. TaxID=1872532 RepID=UPI003F145BC6